MKICVLTSGGDSPGMNAAIRAIVRISAGLGLEVCGIIGGFQGILDRQFEDMDSRSVSRIIQRGGTCLKTGRSEEFKKKGAQEKAASILRENGFEALIAIGGDGTMKGLSALESCWDGITIGLPGTIDNDVYGTDYSIGFDTAVNNAIDAIDKIRDTAEAFTRVFLIEVMGRYSGAIAAHVGIAVGASAIILPETPTDLHSIADKIIFGREIGKESSIIVVAEGDEAGDATTIAKTLSEMVNEKCRVSVLGYLQRGGNPSHLDRILATRLGAHAVHCIRKGVSGVMVGEVNGELATTPYEYTWKKTKPLDKWILELIDKLAT